MGIVAVAVMLLAGMIVLPVLNIQVSALQIKPAQLKNQIIKSTPKQLYVAIANTVAKAYPNVNANAVRDLVEQLVLQSARDSGQVNAIKDLRSMTYQILINPEGIASSALAIHSKQIRSDGINTAKKIALYIHDNDGMKDNSGNHNRSEKGNGGGDNHHSNVEKMLHNILKICTAKCDPGIKSIVYKIMAGSKGKTNSIQAGKLALAVLLEASSKEVKWKSNNTRYDRQIRKNT